jgi:hypothetical protein
LRYVTSNYIALHYITLHDITLHLLQPGRLLELDFVSTVGQTCVVLEHCPGDADGLFGLPLCFEEEDALVECDGEPERLWRREFDPRGGERLLVALHRLPGPNAVGK